MDKDMFFIINTWIRTYSLSTIQCLCHTLCKLITILYEWIRTYSLSQYNVYVIINNTTLHYVN